MGVDSFRFSISWSRILPHGTIRGGVNHQGVEFYERLILTLLKNDIEPIVTLYHWDLPQALEDKYGGFLKMNIVDDYLDYVDLCFKKFGNKVKKWITFNEPDRFILGGYEDGHLAPGRCSRYAGHCTNGNSAKEPYLAMHYLLLAHAKAVDLYRKQYKVEQNGIVGITLQVTWMIPKFHTYESCLAAYRGLDFLTGWILHPITFGDYPETVKSLVGCRLPKFTEDESKLLIGSIDFLGVNYYAATYAEESNISCIMNQGPSYDNRVNLTISRHSLRIGEQITGTEIFVYPKGIEEVVMYIKENYNNPIMYITENGINDPDFPDPQDTVRIEYHKKHLCYLLQAIKLGAKVKGYFAWTFLDNFEWSSGYTKKYGFYRVDRKSMARTAKASVRWFTDFLKPVPKFVNYEEPAYSLLSAA